MPDIAYDTGFHEIADRCWVARFEFLDVDVEELEPRDPAAVRDLMEAGVVRDVGHGHDPRACGSLCVRVRGPASRPAAFSPLGAARCALAARPCRTGRGGRARYGRSLSPHALVGLAL